MAGRGMGRGIPGIEGGLPWADSVPMRMARRMIRCVMEKFFPVFQLNKLKLA